MTVRARLRPEQWRYVAAHATSQAAQWLLHAALVLVVAGQAHIVVGLGALVFARLLPSLLFAIPGGIIVDRLGVRPSYPIGAILRGLTILPIFLLGTTAAAAIAVALLYSLASQIYAPAELALVNTVWRERPAQAHAFMVVLQKGGQAVGVVAVVPLYFAGGALAMFAGAVAGFAILTVACVVVVRSLPAPATLVTRAGASIRPAVGDIIGIFRELPLVRGAVTLLALRSAILYSVVIALTSHLHGPFSAGSPGFWTVGIAGIAGATFGLGLGSRLPNERLANTMAASWHGVTLSLFALAIAMESFGIPVATVAALTLGIGLSLALVSGRAVLSSSTPADRQAGVFAAHAWASDIVMLVPMAAVGVALTTLGVRETVAVLALTSLGMHLVMGGGLGVLPRPRMLFARFAAGVWSSRTPHPVRHRP